MIRISYFTGMWTTPVVCGELPPPSVDFSFTCLDEYRTLMYGGFQPESGTSSEAYILNMDAWVSSWSMEYLNKFYPGLPLYFGQQGCFKKPWAAPEKETRIVIVPCHT